MKKSPSNDIEMDSFEVIVHEASGVKSSKSILLLLKGLGTKLHLDAQIPLSQQIDEVIQNIVSGK